MNPRLNNLRPLASLLKEFLQPESRTGQPGGQPKIQLRNLHCGKTRVARRLQTRKDILLVDRTLGEGIDELGQSIRRSRLFALHGTFSAILAKMQTNEF